MADVKRGNGIPSLPLKKPLNFNHSSSSYKHIYDDVFTSPIQSRQQSPTFIEDDYAEMFGSSRSNNGTWSISYSSIPMLDLPPPSEMRVRGASGVTTVSGERGGEVDYSGVFGGFGDGNFGLPDGEGMFNQFNQISKSSSNVIPRGKVRATEPPRTEIFRQSENYQSPTSISTQSTDSLPDFEQKKNKAAMRKSGEITKAAHARDFPGATQKMEEAVLPTTLSRKTPATKDGTQLGKGADLEKTQGKNGRHMSMDFGADAQKKNSDFPKESDLTAPNSVDMANDMPQPAKGLTNLLSQPSDSEEQFDHMKNETLNTETSEAICATDVESIHESTLTVYEVDPTWNNMSSETSFAKDDTETKMGINTAEKQGKHSRNSSSEFKASKHSSVSSLDESQEACQPSLEGGISKTVGDDFDINFAVRRKKRSRITSLDLRDHRTSHEGDEQLQRKSRLGSSYSFDASHDPQTAHVKVHPSMMALSSSLPQFFPVESHYKVSENSSWRNFGSDVHKGFGVSPPSLEEQLDMNSDAALSVAALQRAIEKAAMIIQMAKESLEIEGQGSSKLRFKDTLEVKAAKDEMDKFQQARTHENFLLTDTSLQKLPFLKETFKAKVIKDSRLADEMNKFQQTAGHGICTPIDNDKERHSLSQRKSVLGNVQTSSVSEDPNFFEDKPVLKDQKEFVLGEGCIEETIMYNDGPLADCEKERLSVSERNGQSSLLSEDPKKSVETDRNVQDRKNFILDKGCIEERNPNMSNLIDERDRDESGGEWEAAKHLNQLICGVKNKIASFMAWQSDTEKKDDLMETRPSRRSQLQSEESEPDLIDVLNTKVKSAEKNQDDFDCPGEHVEMEIGFLSETVGPYENESFLNNIAGQEIAKSCVDLNPNIAVFASEKFMFCPFRNEGVCDSSDSNEEGNNGSDECMEIEFTSLHDKVLDEMKDEQLPGKCEKQNHEALDEICTTLDRVEPETNTEETNEMVEEPCFLPVKDRNEVTDEEVSNRREDEECREDLITFSHLPGSTTEKVDENGKCEGYGVTAETENCEHDAQILEDTNLEGERRMSIEATGGTRRCQELDKDLSQTGHVEEVAEQMDGGHEFITNDILTEQDAEIEDVPAKASFIEIDTVPVQTESSCIGAKASFIEIDTVSVQTGSSCIEVISEEMAEGESLVPASDYEHAKTEIEHREDASNDLSQQAACFVTVEDDSSLGVEDAVSSDESHDMTTEEMADESSITAAEYERTKTENGHIEDTTNDLAQQAACFITVEDDSSAVAEEAVSSHENSNLTTEIPNQAAEPQLEKEETVLFYDSFVELDGITQDLDVRNTLLFENSVLDSSQSDVYARKEEIETNSLEVESLDILENRTKHVRDLKETMNVGEINTMNSQEAEKCGIEAVQRRRWFDGVKVVPKERPSILEGNVTDMETDQEVLDESVLDGSVEVHVDKLHSEVIYSKEPDISVTEDSGSINLESTPKRRRWSVKIGEEGLPVPPPIFQGINVNLEESPKNVNETLPHSKSESSLHKLNAESGKSQNVTESGVSLNGGKGKTSVEAAPRRKRWFGSGENMETVSKLENNEDAGINLGIDQESKLKGHIESPTGHEAEVEPSKVESVTDKHLDEVNKKEKEKEKERIVVERAIREARERAFVEAKEKAKRDASERPNVDACHKSVPGVQERAGKVPSEARTSADKALDAKLRAERAAVERATSEARERALQKALSDKDSHRSREHAGRLPAEKNMSPDPNFQSSSSSSRVDLSNKGEKYDGLDSETAEKRKARMERQSQTMERPANAFEEKNRRDLLLQIEQAAKNMIADSLDAEVKRWSSGKEGNLRVLLSTLQHILGPESGWLAISLTDLVAPTAVRKAYKKATLCVHPDKLQQRGATIQQKYICEKVFELLKNAWRKLNPDER